MKIFSFFLFTIYLSVSFSQDSKLAENYFLDENFQAAISEYELLIEENKDNIEYNFNLVVC